MVVDSKLIILNELGELILARVNPERYEELARTSVLSGELTWTPPILHRGRVYIRNQTRAVFVGEPERLKADGPLLPSPTYRSPNTPTGRPRCWPSNPNTPSTSPPTNG